MTTLTAITAASFINSLGVNTHIDFDAYGYQNLATVESSLEYLGVKNVRDSAESSTDLTSWLQVAQATGVKFDDYMPEGSPASLKAALNLVPQLDQEGILNFIEGGNEEDDSYAASQGNTLAITAQFQQQIYAMGQQLGLPVINMSFGSGWTAANNWQGDYGAVGDLSAYANYGNGHTYPNPGQTPDAAIQMINALAPLAAASRQVITTEIGWDNATFSQASVAQYVVDAALDGIKDGDAKLYYYSLFDDGSGQFGLMNQDGTPKPAGTALHDLTTLLADTGPNAATFKPGSLTFTLSGKQGTDNTLLIQKSNGSDWLALWDESATAHTVTLTLPTAASEIEVFDPVTGTSAIASYANTAKISVNLGGDPLLIEIIPSSGGSGSGGSGSGSGSGGGASNSTPDPVVTAPSPATVGATGTVAVKGVSIADPWAASNPGSLALTVSDSNGSITMLNASGGKLAGSGTGTIAVDGTLAQINAELATLSYTAGITNASINVNIWDQAGVEANKTFDVAVNALAPNPVVTVPAMKTVATSGKVAISGASIADSWATHNPGSLALTVAASDGTVTMLASGTKLPGSGTSTIEVNGTLAQINADLSTLTFTAGTATGTGAVTVDVWDQAGVQATRSTSVIISKPVITIAAGNANPVENVSNAVITATSGNHAIIIGGSSDMVTATGGTEAVQAKLGNNTITTGTGNDTLRFAGSNNVINAGNGNDVLYDTGSNTRIVMPAAGQGYDDIYGSALTNGDVLDLRSLLAATSWNGTSASIGNFLKVSMSNNSAVFSVDPTGTAGGASYFVATFEASGQANLSAMSAHIIT